MNHDIESLMNSVEEWLVNGNLNPSILTSDFMFSSPFWKQANKSEFLAKFLDPSEYIEKSLSNIIKFDPIVKCIGKNNSCFTLTLTYHTKNGCSVDEVVVCSIKSGLICCMKTIYDLEQTKKAHNL